MNTSLKTAIMSADSKELDVLIRMIKARQSIIAQETASSLNVGDVVEFDAKTRGVIVGEILKINQKSVQVKQRGGRGAIWKVYPSLLKKVA
jgi:hypothetical protein